MTDADLPALREGDRPTRHDCPRPVAAKLIARSLRVQDLGPAVGQPGDSHLQAVVDEVDIGARSVVAIHDALRDQSGRQMRFMRRLDRFARRGIARSGDHTREQNGADARGCQARQVTQSAHRTHHSTP
ncbi:hypothetical protein [Sphingomonas sp.]|uniref:hypothetical protein n=1 Tax=Sphingomonas sp. TaxID=28214 RepID=UPI002585E606|nr:hypothetical protein [Sphingomonas sp.]